MTASPALAADIPRLAMTASVMGGGRERLLAAGGTACFAKPIAPLTIIHRIHRILAEE